MPCSSTGTGSGRTPQWAIWSRAARSRILDGGGGHAALPERPREQSEGLGHPADHDDVVGLGADAPGAAEPGDQLGAQFGGTARVAIAEVIAGDFVRTNFSAFNH